MSNSINASSLSIARFFLLHFEPILQTEKKIKRILNSQSNSIRRYLSFGENHMVFL